MSDRIPTYRRKITKNGVYAVVTLPDGAGVRRDVLLGRYGTKEGRTDSIHTLRRRPPRP